MIIYQLFGQTYAKIWFSQISLQSWNHSTVRFRSFWASLRLNSTLFQISRNDISGVLLSSFLSVILCLIKVLNFLRVKLHFFIFVFSLRLRINWDTFNTLKIPHNISYLLIISTLLVQPWTPRLPHSHIDTGTPQTLIYPHLFVFAALRGFNDAIKVLGWKFWQFIYLSTSHIRRGKKIGLNDMRRRMFAASMIKLNREDAGFVDVLNHTLTSWGSVAQGLLGQDRVLESVDGGFNSLICLICATYFYHFA